MAGIFDKFINSMKLSDDEDFEYDDNEDFEGEDFEEEEYFEEEVAPKKRFFGKEKAVFDMERQESQRSRKDDTVVPLRSNSRSMEVCMVKAANVDDGREICDILLSGRAVVINLEGMQTEMAQRIIDFASGACYTMNGNLQMISSYIFIATPQSVELSGDFKNLIDSEGNAMKSYDINI